MGLQAAAFEGADCFEAAEDADGAVVHAGVGDGVGVGAGGYGGKLRLGTGPTHKGVADGVFADLHAFAGGEVFQPGAGAKVVGREDDTTDGGAFVGGFRMGEGGEGLEFFEQAVFVDLDLHGAK